MYTGEPGANFVFQLLRGAESALCRLGEIEINSAIARWEREGRISQSSRARARQGLRDHAELMIMVDLTPQVAQLAIDLVARRDLRAGDAVQLASCLWLRQSSLDSVVMVCFDHRLAEAARAEGLEVKP